VPGFSGIEELIYPFIALDRSKLKFTVLPDHMWSGPSERSCFDGIEAEVERLQPLRKCPLVGLSIAERAKDNARRKLAGLSLEDIDGLRTDKLEFAASFFGFRKLFKGEGRNAADATFADVPATMITAYVRGQFACLITTFGFPNTLSAEVPDSDAGPNEDVEPGEDGMSPSDEIDTVQPAKKKARLVEEEEELLAVVRPKRLRRGTLRELTRF
jgi:hypothetical protein